MVVNVLVIPQKPAAGEKFCKFNLNFPLNGYIEVKLTGELSINFQLQKSNTVEVKQKSF